MMDMDMDAAGDLLSILQSSMTTSVTWMPLSSLLPTEMTIMMTTTMEEDTSVETGTMMIPTEEMIIMDTVMDVDVTTTDPMLIA